MKKLLLSSLALAAALSISAAELGELPLGEKVTINKGDTYSYNPTQDGVLVIDFEGQYPENGIVHCDLYSSSINPLMEMLDYIPFSEATWMGPVSPAKYQIKVYQPAASGSSAKVNYEIVGPVDRASLTFTATFEEAGTIDAIEITSLSQEPGGVFNFNESGTLTLEFDPFVSDLRCGSIKIDMFFEGSLVKTITGSQREIELGLSGGTYRINLTNLWDYELAGNDIDAFTLTLSDFNYTIAGQYVNEDGDVVLNYDVDEFYGMIKLEKAEWPDYIYPYGASPETVTITFEAPLNKSSNGEVVILGAYLDSMNQEAAASTNVYVPETTIEDNMIHINFANFSQTGPVNDRGFVVEVDGYRTSGSSMTILVRGFIGEDGSQVQPLLQHVNWQAEKTDDSGETTAIGEVNVENNFAIYNLQGVKISGRASSADVENLPSGLYIVNGKKIWKK